MRTKRATYFGTDGPPLSANNSAPLPYSLDSGLENLWNGRCFSE